MPALWTDASLDPAAEGTARMGRAPGAVPGGALLGGAAAPTMGASGRARVVVCCLGPFQVLVDEHPVTQWRSSRSRALFQFLVNHHDRPISPDALIEALWPDPNAAAPATSLKVAVHGLRTALATDLPQGVVSVVAHNPGYALEVQSLWLDVEEFEQCYLMARSMEQRGMPEEAAMFYQQAASVYRGDFLEDVMEEWPALRRETLKDQYLFVATRLARVAVDQRDYEAALFWCQQVLQKDRCREDVYRTLFHCHARLGQRGRVRHWYEFCVRSLRADLDCEPADETNEAYHAALASR